MGSRRGATPTMLVCDILEIRARYLLQIVIRDNAGGSRAKPWRTTSNLLGPRIISLWPTSNGLAESSIGSLMLLTRSQIGLRWLSPAWVEDSGSELSYRARMLVMQHITTGLERLLITLCLRNPGTFPSSELSDARRSCTWTRIVVRKASISREQQKGYIWDLHPTVILVGISLQPARLWSAIRCDSTSPTSRVGSNQWLTATWKTS